MFKARAACVALSTWALAITPALWLCMLQEPVLPFIEAELDGARVNRSRWTLEDGVKSALFSPWPGFAAPVG
jgi:hypothetical protein